jgi:hypothetical protein
VATVAQDVITMKLERSFDAMGDNQDGHLDWTDHQKLGDRHIQAYRLDRRDRRARAIQTYCQGPVRHRRPAGRGRHQPARLWRSEAPEALDAFHELDTDGDGAVSRHESVRAVREHYLSDDPEAPGSLFFGRVRPSALLPGRRPGPPGGGRRRGPISTGTLAPRYLRS